MYVDNVLDWIRNIFLIIALLLSLVIAGFLIFTKLQNEADSIKTKLEIENLKLDNELKKIQLKELGFDFTEESKQIVEE